MIFICCFFVKKLLTPTLRNSLRYVYREEEMTMMTVNEVSKLTGVSIRTLQYYDTIGLLKPIEYTEPGYRLYDDTSLERLQQILLFKELEFPLKEIKKIIDAPNFDRNKALEQQIELLTMKKEHLCLLYTSQRDGSRYWRQCRGRHRYHCHQRRNCVCQGRTWKLPQGY